MSKTIIQSLVVLWAILMVSAPGFGQDRQSNDVDIVVDYNNVVIVLDASGSMKEKMSGTTMRKMDAAKAALKEVLKQVPPDTQIGLLVFCKHISGKNEWIYPLGRREDKALMRAIEVPEPGGGTPLGGYIKKGADRLLEQRKKQHGYGTYRLLVVTDGEAQDQKMVDRFVPEVMARGITIDVIGVNMSTKHTLATKVHSYRSAADPDSLKTAIAEVFAEVEGGDTGPAGEDAFEVLAPIPVELASHMIKSLSTSGNEPIGLKYRPGQSDSNSSSKSSVPSTPPPEPDDGGSSILMMVIIFIAALFVIKPILGRRR